MLRTSNRASPAAFRSPDAILLLLVLLQPTTNQQPSSHTATHNANEFFSSFRARGGYSCVRDELLHDTLLCVCVCVCLQCACLPHNKLCAHAINCFLSLTTRTKLVYCNKMATIHRPKTTTKDPLIDNQ
jgi:hypothetical protein